MINKFKGYNEINIIEGSRTLPAGGYELKIINAKVETISGYNILKIAFDIVAPSNYAGYFTQKFKIAKQTNPDTKWAGTFDVFIPCDDNSSDDERTKYNFKRFIVAVEKSNNDYKWDWNENSLKNKLVGGIFGREQFQSDDGTIKWTTKYRSPYSIEGIRNKTFYTPNDKLITLPTTNNSASKTTPESINNILADPTIEEIFSDEEIPF